MDRLSLQKEFHSGTGNDRITTFTYQGLSGLVTQEAQEGGTGASTKTFSYDAYGHRISMTDKLNSSTGDPEPYTFGHDVHSSVSQLLDKSGKVRASYGYDAYGGADAKPTDDQALTSGDINDLAPVNPYRYAGRRMDSGTVNSSGTAGALPNGSGGYDMGARRYGPDTVSFLQQDMFSGALANLGLSLDPLSQNRYALAGGNPVSYVETDGRRVTEDGYGDGASSPAPTNDYDAGRQAYFSPEGDSDERLIIQDEKFKAPGNGIIVTRFFVKEKDAAGGILYGDNRGFTTDPNAPYRVAVAWDTERGEVSYSVTASRTQETSVDAPHFDGRFPYVARRPSHNQTKTAA